MAQLDFAKEQLGILKLVIGIISGIFVALVGWLTLNFESAKGWILVACIMLLVVLLIFGALISKMIYKKLYEIKDL